MLGEIHFHEDGDQDKVRLLIEAVRTVAEKHGGSLREGHLSEDGWKFKVIAPDEKLPIIRKELLADKLPLGIEWTSAKLAQIRA